MTATHVGPVHYLPILTTLISAAFCIVLWRRYVERGGTHHLWWALGIACYGLGTAIDYVNSVGKDRIVLVGEIAPGPDYKLYLAPEFVETEADFARLKPGMARVGDVKTFKNFVVPVPDGIDVERYSTVIVWCETFSQFITAARYK